jgi:hypothetical protein
MNVRDLNLAVFCGGFAAQTTVAFVDGLGAVCGGMLGWVGQYYCRLSSLEREAKGTALSGTKTWRCLETNTISAYYFGMFQHLSYNRLGTIMLCSSELVIAGKLSPFGSSAAYSKECS